MDDFNWRTYLERYKDLVDAGIRTEKDAISHYKKHGKKEGRIGYKKQLLCYFHTLNQDTFINSYIISMIQKFLKLGFELKFYTNSPIILGYYDFDINYMIYDEETEFFNFSSSVNINQYSHVLKINDSIILPINGMNSMIIAFNYYRSKFKIWGHWGKNNFLLPSFVDISTDYINNYNIKDYSKIGYLVNIDDYSDEITDIFKYENDSWIYRNDIFSLGVLQLQYIFNYRELFPLYNFGSIRVTNNQLNLITCKKLYILYVDPLTNISSGNSNTTLNLIKKISKYLYDVEIVLIDLNNDINHNIDIIDKNIFSNHYYLVICNHHSLNYHPSCISVNNFIDFIPKRKTFLYTFWELDRFSDQFQYEMRNIDVVLVSSEYNMETYRNNIIKFNMNQQVEYIRYFDYSLLNDISNSDINIKKELGWENKIVFFLIFSFNSDENRKNPEDVVKVFLKLTEKYGNIKLFIKSNPAGIRFSNEYKYGSKIFISDKICECPDDVNIFHLNDYISSDEINSLYKSFDFYFSLQRSEGLGIPFLKAFEYGIHCITTGYSSVSEFCNEENSTLVDYELRNVEIVSSLNKVYRISDAKWAYPNLEDCYVKISNIIDNYDEYINRRLNIKNSLYEYYMINDLKIIRSIFT